MRKIFLPLFIFMSLSHFTSAQLKFDSTEFNKLTKRVVDTTTFNKFTKDVKDSLGTVQKKIDTIYNKTNEATKACNCYDHPLNGKGDWFLILLPVIVFISLFIVSLMFGLSKFNIADALTESEYTKSVVINPMYTADNIKALSTSTAANTLDSIIPPTLEVSQIPQDTSSPPVPEIPPKALPSMSRYIVFLTSIMTLIIALCMACFFIYYYIRTGCAPDLSPLSMILLALGVGVVPYAFNKVSTAIASKKQE